MPAPDPPPCDGRRGLRFHGRTLSGTEEIRERWKRGVSLVESLLGDAVGRLYTERHFPDAKARMDVLVDNLLEAYRVNITDLEWMTPPPASARWPSWTSSPPRSATREVA